MIVPLPPTTGPAACPAMPGSPPASPLIYLLFAECAYSRVEAASVVLGYASVLCWVGAQMPQVLQNWRRQSAAGLAIPFIAVWLLGDVANYLGSALTHQRPFQVLLAAYFCFVDAALLVQCLWYNHRAASRRPTPKSATSSPSMTAALTAVSAVASFASPAHALPATLSTTSTPIAAIVGTTASYLCTVLYLTSRVPQLVHNHRRRSVRGLAMGMVACAVAGNATYAASVALRGTTVADVGEYWAAALPFFMGSAGTLAMDAALIAQWWWWRDASADDEEVVVDATTVENGGKAAASAEGADMVVAVDAPPPSSSSSSSIEPLPPSASSSRVPVVPRPPPVPVTATRLAATERTPLLARTWPEL
ncbi:PQ loop repeat-containing protein 2 [Allomyces arbusculus]|nr:PQ loop repeat-containing protein 2 [Allomyces arbusculus]